MEKKILANKDTYREFLFNTYKPLVQLNIKKKKKKKQKTQEKIGQRKNAHFSKEVIKMAIRHMK